MIQGQLLERMAKRFSEGAYRVESAVQLADGTTASLAASRTYFSPKGLVILSQHIVIRELADAGVSEMQALSTAAFRLAKKRNRIPLLRGMQFGYMVLPVIVTPSRDPDLVRYVTNTPRKRWALFEFPVLVDANTSHADYFRNTSFWGALYFTDMRSVVERFIEEPPQAQPQ